MPKKCEDVISPKANTDEAGRQKVWRQQNGHSRDEADQEQIAQLIFRAIPCQRQGYYRTSLCIQFSPLRLSQRPHFAAQKRINDAPLLPPELSAPVPLIQPNRKAVRQRGDRVARGWRRRWPRKFPIRPVPSADNLSSRNASSASRFS